jgi:hypothetical protein
MVGARNLKPRGFGPGAALRLVAAWILLTVAFWQAGGLYSAIWCRPVAWLVGSSQMNFASVTVDLAPIDDQPAFRIRAIAADPLVARYPVMPPGTLWTAGTLQAYAHLHPTLILAVAIAWPVTATTRRLRLLAAAVPAVAASTLLDLPFALYGLLMSGVYGMLDPDRADLLMYYSEFLQRGGRTLLPVVAAATLVILADRPVLTAGGGLAQAASSV